MSGAPAPAAAAENRCRFIEHQGKQILFHDLSNIMNPSDGFPVVGLAGLQKVIYVTLTQLSGRRLPTFATIDAAEDWLVAQA